MSTLSGRYVRCPHCNFMNLNGSDVCSECGTGVDEELSGELRRVAADVWAEVWKLVAAATAGILAGGLIALVGALASRGLWLTSLAAMLTPSMRPGATYLGPFLLAAVPIVWLILGRMEVHQVGGKVELFNSDEVQCGAWASGLLTVCLASIGFLFFAGPPAGSEAAEPLRPAIVWQALPLLCQGGAIVTAVATLRWLDARELSAPPDEVE